MRAKRRTTIAIAVTAFVTGAVTATLLVLVVIDHAGTDRDLGHAARVADATTPPTEVIALAHADSDDVTDLRGRHLVIPVEGVDRTVLRSSFHDARTGGRTHEAMDILAPRNTPVRAVVEGTIAKLFLSAAGGLTVYEFDDDQRFAFYYAHLERYAPGLREQDRVRRGAVIGFVGTSGNAPPNTPHLHFAIFKLGPDRHWWEGDPIDPFTVWQH